MKPIRTILVAVKDPGIKSSAALKKGAALARAMGARLELFHAIAEPIAVDLLMYANQNLKQFEAAERARQLKRLDALATPLLRSGLRVGTAVEWDYPVHEAVVRRANQVRADLIIAERHVRRHVAPWFLRYADWELLRRSRVPVLIVKNPRNYSSPKILAAVDPSHAFDKTFKLDKEILGAAREVNAAVGGELHVVHAYVPTIIGMKPADLNSADATEKISRHAQAIAKRGMGRLLRGTRTRLEPSQCHLVARHAVDVIPELASRIPCDIVVMGALSRSGLRRLAIGNTAERLLDELACDVLIVKPPGFAGDVITRSRGSQLLPVLPSSGVL